MLAVGRIAKQELSGKRVIIWDSHMANVGSHASLGLTLTGSKYYKEMNSYPTDLVSVRNCS